MRSPPCVRQVLALALLMWSRIAKFRQCVKRGVPPPVYLRYVEQWHEWETRAIQKQLRAQVATQPPARSNVHPPPTHAVHTRVHPADPCPCALRVCGARAQVATQLQGPALLRRILSKWASLPALEEEDREQTEQAYEIAAEHAPHACVHVCILMCVACAWRVRRYEMRLVLYGGSTIARWKGLVEPP